MSVCFGSYENGIIVFTRNCCIFCCFVFVSYELLFLNYDYYLVYNSLVYSSQIINELGKTKAGKRNDFYAWNFDELMMMMMMCR